MGQNHSHQPLEPFSNNSIIEERKNKNANTIKMVAEKHATKLQHEYLAIMNDIKNQRDSNNDNNISIKNMNELLDKVRTSNKKIMNGLDNQERTLETSNRLIWYTNQSLDKYKTYDYVVSIILNIFMVIAIISFMYHKKYRQLVIIIVFYLLIKQFL
jgi:hypothetical protein|tara:strand:+ start:1172 stop:1642 length:471 start_codon:yes stop_codon:yes gene_type:complete